MGVDHFNGGGSTVLCGFHNQGWDAVGRALASRYGAVFVDGSACYDSRYRGPDGLHMTKPEP